MLMKKLSWITETVNFLMMKKIFSYIEEGDTLNLIFCLIGAQSLESSLMEEQNLYWPPYPHW